MFELELPYKIEEYCVLAPTLILSKDSLIRSHAVIYGDTVIGERFQTGHHILIREFTEIGDDCSVGSMTEIGHHVKIGNKVRIHSRCFIPEYTEIRDGAWIMPGVIITNVRYPRCPKVKTCARGIRGVLVGENSIIGAGALILPGVKIGEGAMVAAGAVVTKDVLPGEIVLGFPAERYKLMSELECPEGIEGPPYGSSEG